MQQKEHIQTQEQKKGVILYFFYSLWSYTQTAGDADSFILELKRDW